MTTVTVDHYTQLFVRDWGTSTPIVLCAGWTLSSDIWQQHMLSLTRSGRRCVAFDRRGHGRSDDPGGGYDYDTLADDLAAVLDALDLRHVCLVGHSMAAGELVRYITRHGYDRVTRLLFVAPAPLRPADPALIDQVEATWRDDLGGWARRSASAYFATDHGNALPPQVIDRTIDDMLRTSLQAAVDCNRAMLSTDWTDEVSKLRLPVLFVHGDADTSVPPSLSSEQAVRLVPGARLRMYAAAGHGLYLTHAERLTGDILDFSADD